MHPDQLAVTSGPARRLIAEQFPSWAHLPIRTVASHGTVNTLFRIGDGLAARFPLQPADPLQTLQWLKDEAAAARELLDFTPFATPNPSRWDSPEPATRCPGWCRPGFLASSPPT